MEVLMKILKNKKGQSLVEYLVIVAIVGVGSIAIMRSVGQNIQARFANVVHALGGNVEGDRTAAAVKSSSYKKRDLKDFARGTVTGKTKSDGEDSE